ncbi:MAG: IS110 family transposase [Oscillospiraceae bacterium]|jgi:transposase|nr:IS110 family transposase [Oscillospiraceae bacterium]
MERALGPLQEAEKQFGKRPVLVIESTSHYHLILFQFFRKAGYEVIVVNPIQSGALRNIKVRKLKTDKVDAYRLAMLYRIKVLRPSQVPMDALRGLRLLYRQRFELTHDITCFKNRLTALLDQIFPGYEKVFADVGGSSSIAVLSVYPTPQTLVQEDPDTLATPSRSGASFGKKKAEALLQAATGTCRIGLDSPGNAAIILSTIAVLNSLKESKSRLEQEIQELISREQYIRNNLALLQTIPGIGPQSAAVILSEIGNISLFQKPKQLAAYFGLDPSERQSGTFHSSKNKLSKRGSPYVRAMLHMAAHNSVHSTKKHLPGRGNPVLAKKCRSKPPKVAMCTVMHKLSNIIFAVLRDQKPSNCVSHRNTLIG